MRHLLRERGLAVVALLLAIVGLASGGHPGANGQRVSVVIATRTVPVGSPVVLAAVRLVSIDAADRTPGMATARPDVVGRIARVRLTRGDYIVRAAVASRTGGLTLAPDERAVPLSLEVSAAPPLSLLPAGARVDVVAEHDADRDGPARSELVARRLTLLVAARTSTDGLVVTVRAPLKVALALATAQAQAHRLRLFALPAVAHG